MSNKKPKLLVIVGPTGSGKTSLSINLAQAFNGEVISADSRQVYKNLDIGTEKVTTDEMKGVPHHLLDVADLAQTYTAVDFARDAKTAIEKITKSGHLPIIAGGTFFYLDTLLGKVSTPAVPPDLELRKELESLSTNELFARLQKIDPKRASTIDSQNPRRLVRALEIAADIGHVPPPSESISKYDTLTLGIEVDKVVLRSRLRTRAQSAIERGLVEEIEALLKGGADRSRLSEIGLQYPLVIDFIDGNITKEELIQKLEEKNWQYAKRQWLWLKRNEEIVWIDPTDMSVVVNKVQEWLQK